MWDCYTHTFHSYFHLFFFNNNFIELLIKKLGFVISATQSSIVMLYTDFSASRQTRLLVFPKVYSSTTCKLFRRGISFKILFIVLAITILRYAMIIKVLHLNTWCLALSLSVAIERKLFF